MYVLVYATKTKLQHLFDKGAVVGEPKIQYFIFINGWANKYFSFQISYLLHYNSWR